VFSWLLTPWGFYGSGQMETCSEYGIDNVVSIGGHCFCDVASRSGGHIHNTATSGATLDFLTDFLLVFFYSCFLPFTSLSANMDMLLDTRPTTGCLFTASNAILQWRRSGGHACIPLWRSPRAGVYMQTDIPLLLDCYGIVFCRRATDSSLEFLARHCF
jgi:hypothetical protein